MNKDLMRQLGFVQEVEAVENRQCPFCRLTVNLADFRDDLSLKEYQISGLCMDCQDKVFKEPDDEPDDYFDEINYNPYSGHNELDDVNYLDWEGDE